MPSYIDLTNQRFGRLLVLKDAGRRRGTVIWLCRCDCSNEAIVNGVELRRGETVSCGCRHRDGSIRRTHGMSWGRSGTTITPEYNTWLLMRNRCNNPNDARYKDYGGRGIAVCKQWDSFEIFLADMGPRPKGYSIERVNVDGNYEPNNCKWIPLREQSRNRRLKTQCRKGHELTPENVLLFHDGIYLHRHCRKCAAMRDREYKARQRVGRLSARAKSLR